MANWHSIDAKKFLPDMVGKLITGLHAANDGLAAALSVTRAGLQVAKLSAAVVAQNPIETALRLAIEEIQEFIRGIATRTGVYALVIPIQKQYVEGPSFAGFDQFHISGWLDNSPQTQGTDAANTLHAARLINDSVQAQGGNAGYWREFALSLHDSGDPARPLFPVNYAVTGVSVIFGGASARSLYALADFFQTLMDFGRRSDMMARTRPVLTDFRARVVPLPEEGTLGIQLEWTPAPLILRHTAYTQETMRVREIILIRSTDPRIRERFTWSKNFDFELTPLPENAESIVSWPQDDNEPTQILARIKNDGFISRYITKEKLDTRKIYFYAAALLYEIDDVIQPVGHLSNVEAVYYNGRAGTSRKSEPPDWFATPSLVQMFPILQDVIGQAELYLAGLLSRTTSHSGVAQLLLQTMAHIDLLLREVDLVSRSLRRLEAALRHLSNTNLAGVYATNITVDTGGIQRWARELAQRLADPTDDSRPSFDHNELVAGFVIVAGAPREPELRPVRELLELFFGSRQGHPLEKVLADLDPPVTPGRPLFGTQGGFRQDPTRNPSAGFDAALMPLQETEAKKEPTPDPKRSIVFDETLQPSTRDANC